MNDEVKEYYDSNAKSELNRLDNNYSLIEFMSTMYLIDKYVAKGSSILDCGAGPGRYALELLNRGYEVTLLDLSKESIEIAKQNIEKHGLLARDYIVDSATNLDRFENESFDSVIVLGPLYHLHENSERKKVLEDVFRILKPNGVAIFAYINSYGLLRASVTEFPEGFCEEKLNTMFLKGDLKLTSENSFTKAYFTTHKLAIDEVEKTDFQIISTAGAESFLSGMKLQLDELRSKSEELYQEYVKVASRYCELDDYKHTTEHFLIVAQKP